MQAKLINIGNSKGLRIPKNLIIKYHLQPDLNIVELEEGILIKADLPKNKLSWEETYKNMGKEKENWEEWDVVADDGIDIEW